MTRPLRSAHLTIWISLSALLAMLLVGSLYVRPSPPPSNANLPVETRP